MRLRDSCMLVASLSLSVMAGASLATAKMAQEPEAVLLTVTWPEPPEPALSTEPQEPAATASDVVPEVPFPTIALSTSFEDIQVIPLGPDPVTREFTIATLRRAPDVLRPDWGEVVWCITIYRCVNKPKIGWDLELLTSRNIEFDAGMDLLRNDGTRDYRPETLRRVLREVQKKTPKKD